MRNDEWLKNRMDKIWDQYFSDIKHREEVHISFGRRAFRTLGSIRKSRDKLSTKITVTSVFQDKNIPEFMIDATIAHELCHFAHGFFSPLPKLSKHPHKGGIVNKEMIERGLEKELKMSKAWLKKEWPAFAKLKVKRRKLRVRRMRRIHKYSLMDLLFNNLQ